MFRFGVGDFPEATVMRFNRDFLKQVAALRPTIVWVEKAVLLLPKTLLMGREMLPRACWVSYQDDNPFGQRRYEIPTWRYFKACIPHYDIHFVKRDSDVDHFTWAGARRVVISRTGFYPPFHRPYRNVDIPAYFKHDTVFVGTALDHRVSAIATLMDKKKIRVDVYGSRWNRHWVSYRHPSYFHGYSGTLYPQIISGGKISLGYVSSSNLDEYNGRSVEIPACGGFLLAERTPTHLELYHEGKEAEYFSSTDECADKIRFYLRESSKREAIAKAGYERCLRSDYSLTRSMREAMGEIAATLEHKACH
jgi:hypothetical protein